MSTHADMSKLAHLLRVDEVSVEHGSKGFAIGVRVGDEWLATTFDRADLDTIAKSEFHGHRLDAIADRLSELADKLRGVNRAPVPLPLREDTRASYTMPTRRAYEADRQQELPPPASRVDAVVQEQRMESRFHAIVAELNKL